MNDADLDALLEPSRYVPGRCHVAQDLDRIQDPQHRARVAAALRDRNVPSENVAAAFTHLIGWTPAENPLRRHRKGACACE